MDNVKLTPEQQKAKRYADSLKSATAIKDAGALNKMITSIATRGKALQADIHTAGVSALYHAIEHKSTAFAMALIEAVPSATRKGALKKWLFHFGCFLIKEDNKTWGIDSDRANMLHAEIDRALAAAAAVPFWEFSADVEDETFIDGMGAVTALINRLTKAKDAGKLKPEEAILIDRLKGVVPAAV